MKYVATICVALLALVLIYQMRILARLDEIAKRPIVVSGQTAPSAATIAAEIRKQMAREARLSSPATFRIEAKTASQAYKGSGESLDPKSGRLQRARLVIVREGGPAANVAVTSPLEIASELERIAGSEECERFAVSFRPESGDYLPDAWSFTITYTDRDQKPQERRFTAAYHPENKHPDYLDLREMNE